ncbi:OmpH family outer membrane protein [Paucibacter sp. JuS9]|uniref:OmpH family outer membrane protein n=1 Tax=Roseateles TaxID=93681 RepID=UPI002FE5A662
MKKLLSTAAAAVLMSLAPLAAQAQVLKIGVLEADRVLREAKAAQAAQARLEAEFGKQAKELQELDTKLRLATDKLEKDAPALSETERQRRGRELADQKRELERRSRRFDEDLQLRRNQEGSALNQRVDRAVRQIFESEKYDLILRDGILMRSPAVDITNKVIEAVDAQK